MIAAINGVIIGAELGYIFKSVDMIPIYMLQVFAGEIAVLAIGLSIYMKIKDMDFMNE